jgi:small subunit ribosomal protein S6
MRKYETIYIVKPDLAEDDLKAVTEKVQEIISGNKAEVKKLEDWGVRKLAYHINKFPRGRYFYLRFDAGADLVAELERRLRLDDRVLRYQSVKLEKEPEAPAPVAVETAPETEVAAEEAPAATEE